MKAKFLYCKTCGNVIVKLADSGVTPVCCGEQMVELVANETDGAREKHIPVIKEEMTEDGRRLTICVGESDHPMAPVHWIEFIVVETEKGAQIKYLKPGDEPKASFPICKSDKVLAVYAYCNIHGLWVSKCC